MTDKPTQLPTGPITDEQHTTGRQPVTSPFDSPTQQLPVVDMAKPRPADVPRTDDELGLDPDVPTVEQTKAGTSAYSYASIPPAANPPNEPSKAARRRSAENRRGTLYFGLFLLRLVVGGTFIYHGLQKLTGWFHGPGLDGTRDIMADGGWDHPSVATILLVAGELGGGILLILGLATPLAAGAVLAVILTAWAWKQGMIPGFQYKGSVPSGVELETILAGTAAAVILTGPGRWSLDRNRGWATRPAWGSFAALLAALLAAAGTYWYLHGGNPLTGIGPFG
ncbi:DoxX family protein [Nocardia amikacinitolerans]|uniref:DoxX family protein n=1 Tax=Nocardia amikacinitolerans TaxID=756689 RepID=UPI0020A2EBAF|nr:DoxX family protein [Nocardia amikacinitolerans]MCP2287360.1 putative oxidoreductase [Nocardia amikacinitolerans]